jgi:SAM-dependent methyltransferase
MNEEMIRLWNEVNGPRWLGIRAEVAAAIAPFGAAAMDALGPSAGARVLDVGCGCGETTLELAARVGSAGAVVGIDVCAPFIEVARAEAAGHANVAYLLADAQSHAFAEPFDAVFSRFGIMFFDDPPAAFARLHAALRPGGRLGAVVWGPIEANEWVSAGLDVVRGHLEVPAPPPGPGPFALADRSALTALLERAGFSAVRVAPLDLPFRAGATATEAAVMLVRVGLAARAIQAAGDEGERLRPRIEAEIADRLRGRVGAGGVSFAASATLVSAGRGGA